MTERQSIPTWFGPEDRPLFGWIHLPDHPTGRGVVLCPSIGLEGETSQFAYRTLAQNLCDVGCAVLRFDYHGTGDSTGLLTEPGRLTEWIADIVAAVDYLRAAGVTRVHLVGARLGAALAARAASEDGGVESLTLWYPWTKGSQFLRYQRALRRLYAVGDDSGVRHGETEIPGFVLDAATTADLKELDTSLVGPTLPGSVLVIDATDSGTGAVARPEYGPPWAVRSAGTGPDALFGVELMRAAVSVEDLQTIQSFILATPAADGEVVLSPTVRTVARVDAPDGLPVTERPVFFGDSGLFGILTEPEDPSHTPVHLGPRVRTTRGPVPEFGAALFLNAGSLHHVGPGRQWVELSRKWAAAGVRCLRMDLGGIGDSPASGPTGILSSYPPSARDDVAEGVHFLSPDDPKQVLLLGLCAGAYHSLLAAPSTGVGGVAVLNPLRVPSPDPKSEAIGELIDGLQRSEWDDFEKQILAEAEVPRHRFLGGLRDRGVFTPVAQRLPDRIWWAARLGRSGKDPVDALASVIDSGASLFVVLGPDEWSGIGRGRTHELRRLARSGVFAITFVPTLDHSFHVASGRKDALVVLDEWVLGTGAGGPASPRGTRTIS
ncbi:MAG: alpha/beta hydrolase [Acidimicrobiales bacterium]|jgi:alpha-beta hydrolase superfamily lysophospholipase